MMEDKRPEGQILITEKDHLAFVARLQAMLDVGYRVAPGTLGMNGVPILSETAGRCDANGLSYEYWWWAVVERP